LWIDPVKVCARSERGTLRVEHFIKGFGARSEIGLSERTPARDVVRAKLENRPVSIATAAERPVLLRDKTVLHDQVDQHAEDNHGDSHHCRSKEGDPGTDRDPTPKCRLGVEPGNNSIVGPANRSQARRGRGASVEGGVHSSFKMYPTPRTVCSRRGRPPCSSFCRRYPT